MAMKKYEKKHPDGTFGRPKKPIDLDAIEKLAGLMCTQEDIAKFLEVDLKTLRKNEEFVPRYYKGKENGKMSLRRAQYNAGVNKGSVPMLIWLGKQHLGQTDKIEQQETNISYDVSKMSDEQIKELLNTNSDTND